MTTTRLKEIDTESISVRVTPNFIEVFCSPTYRTGSALSLKLNSTNQKFAVTYHLHRKAGSVVRAGWQLY